VPWLKAGDNAATHPIAMRVAALVRAIADVVLERDVAVNEVFGFVMRCALQSAGHTTDYVVDEGTAWMLGGPRTERLLHLATRAGYLERCKAGGVRAYRLVDDPDFIHMRLRADIDWERQQRKDASDPTLTVPVRLRDGDACRYCQQVVSFRARKGRQAGTYDHRIPGQPATVDTLVVACTACNSGRRDRDDADQRYPLQPPPRQPLYAAATAAWLAQHGHQVTATTDLRPGTQSDTAAPNVRPGTQPDTAAGRSNGSPDADHPGTTGNTQRPNGSPDAAPTATQPPAGHRGSADSCPPDLDRPGRDGTGRVKAVPPPEISVPEPKSAQKRAARGRPRTRGPS
jgi:5-methylcytosine-specific restriction endonuclease McrA